ncbi:MAG: DNA cytosine methyltransferase, partial [Acidobacteriaceae bacterium]
MTSRTQEPAQQRTFIDLFSGCGGLSLGMTDAGFRGVFAVEKAADAFLTFKANLLDNEQDQRFAWPRWLDKKNIGIEDFLTKYGHRLEKLRGKVSVITGGPPCQGFSFAGRRNGRDPRNKLFRKYVEFVAAVQPNMLVLENVPGMRVIHGVTKRTK